MTNILAAVRLSTVVLKEFTWNGTSTALVSSDCLDLN